MINANEARNMYRSSEDKIRTILDQIDHRIKHVAPSANGCVWERENVSFDITPALRGAVIAELQSQGFKVDTHVDRLVIYWREV